MDVDMHWSICLLLRHRLHSNHFVPALVDLKIKIFIIYHDFPIHFTLTTNSEWRTQFTILKSIDFGTSNDEDSIMKHLPSRNQWQKPNVTVKRLCNTLRHIFDLFCAQCTQRTDANNFTMKFWCDVVACTHRVKKFENKNFQTRTKPKL